MSNQQLAEMRQQHVPRGVGVAHPISAVRAKGSRLWDADGKEYVDFIGGIGVMNIGHNHPKVVEAVKSQLDQITHACFQVTTYEPYVNLAARLNALAPGDDPKKTIFFTSGAEATENAVKISRAYTNRPAVIAFNSSFHGRTLMGMSLTGKSKPYKQNFGPFAPEIYHVPFPYEYRGWSTERALESLHQLFLTSVAPDKVAAIIIEPVLGEGGFVPAPAEFLQELRRITQEHGIVFISDEIQSGFGRTAKMFAIEHSGVVPDLITVAKSLAGGMPLSGVIGRADIMDAPQPGGLGGTYAGNPLACAAASAVLDVFEEENILQKAEAVGQKLTDFFVEMQGRYPQIGDVRGLGAMVAVELVKDPATKEPDAALADQIMTEARERGLLLLKAGLYGNVIRVLVPVTVEEPLLDKALNIIEDSFSQTLGGAA